MVKNAVDYIILLSLFVIRICRGTCSSVEMLKGYVVRERLGTPDQRHWKISIQQPVKNCVNYFVFDFSQVHQPNSRSV